MNNEGWLELTKKAKDTLLLNGRCALEVLVSKRNEFLSAVGLLDNPTILRVTCTNIHTHLFIDLLLQHKANDMQCFISDYLRTARGHPVFKYFLACNTEANYTISDMDEIHREIVAMLGEINASKMYTHGALLMKYFGSRTTSATNPGIPYVLMFPIRYGWIHNLAIDKSVKNTRQERLPEEERVRHIVRYSVLRKGTIMKMICNYDVSLSSFKLPPIALILNFMFSEDMSACENDELRKTLYYLSYKHGPTIPQFKQLHPFCLILGREEMPTNLLPQAKKDIVPQNELQHASIYNVMDVVEVTPWAGMMAWFLTFITARGFTKQFTSHLDIVKENLSFGRRYPVVILQTLGLQKRTDRDMKEYFQTIMNTTKCPSDEVYAGNTDQEFLLPVSYLTYRMLMLSSIKAMSGVAESSKLDVNSQRDTYSEMPNDIRILKISKPEKMTSNFRIQLRCGELLKLVAFVKTRNPIDFSYVLNDNNNFSSYDNEFQDIQEVDISSNPFEESVPDNEKKYMFTFDCFCLGSDLCLISDSAYKILLHLFIRSTRNSDGAFKLPLICINSENYSQNLRVWRSMADYLPRDLSCLQEHQKTNIFSEYNVYNTLSLLCRSEASKQVIAEPLFTIYRKLMVYSTKMQQSATTEDKTTIQQNVLYGLEEPPKSYVPNKRDVLKDLNESQKEFVKFALTELWTQWGNTMTGIYKPALMENRLEHMTTPNKMKQNEKRDEQIESYLHSIKPSRPLILVGPPGTGKTRTVAELIRALISGDVNCTLNYSDKYLKRRIFTGSTRTLSNLRYIKHFMNATIMPSIVLCLCATNNGVDQLMERVVRSEDIYNNDVADWLSAQDGDPSDYYIAKLPYYLPPFIQVDNSAKQTILSSPITEMIAIPLGRITLGFRHSVVSYYKQQAQYYIDDNNGYVVPESESTRNGNTVTNELELMALHQILQQHKQLIGGEQKVTKDEKYFIEMVSRRSVEEKVAFRIGSCGYSNSASDISKQLKKENYNSSNAPTSPEASMTLQVQQTTGTMFPWMHIDVIGREVAICWIPDKILTKNMSLILQANRNTTTNPFYLELPVSTVPCAFVLWCAACIRWAHKQMGNMEKIQQPREKAPTKDNPISDTLSRRVGAARIINNLLPWKCIRNSYTQTHSLTSSQSRCIPSIKLLRNFLLRLGLSSKNARIEQYEIQRKYEKGYKTIDINTLSANNVNIRKRFCGDRFLFRYPDSYGAAVLQLIENEVYGVTKSSYDERTFKSPEFATIPEQKTIDEAIYNKPIIMRGPLEFVLLMQSEKLDGRDDNSLEHTTSLQMSSNGDTVDLQTSVYNFPVSALEISVTVGRMKLMTMWDIRKTTDKAINQVKIDNLRVPENPTVLTRYINVFPFERPSPVLVLGCTIGSLIPLTEMVEGEVIQDIISRNFQMRENKIDHTAGLSQKIGKHENESKIIMFAQRSEKTSLTFKNMLSLDMYLSSPNVEGMIASSILPISLVVIEEAGLASEPEAIHVLHVCAKHNEMIRKTYLSKLKTEDRKVDLNTIDMNVLSRIRPPVTIFAGDPMQLSPFSYGKIGSLQIDKMMNDFLKCAISENAAIQQPAAPHSDITNSLQLVDIGFKLPLVDMSNMYQRLYRSLIEESTMERMIRFNAQIIEKVMTENNNRVPPPPFPTFFLRKQYRMHQDIAMFPTKEFYSNIVNVKRSGDNRRNPGCSIEGIPPLKTNQYLLNNLLIYQPSAPTRLPVFGPYVVFNLNSSESRYAHATKLHVKELSRHNAADISLLSTSIYNETECQFIVNYLILLLRLHPYLANDGVDMNNTAPSDSAEGNEGGSKQSMAPIAVITPYLAQKRRLTELWNETIYNLYNFETSMEPRSPSSGPQCGELELIESLPPDVLFLKYKEIYNFLAQPHWKETVDAMGFGSTLSYDYYDKYISDYLRWKEGARDKPGAGSFPKPLPIQYQQILRAVTFNTIDGFQGQERSVVIVSLVRANNRGELGFVASRKRMNSALTRAKHMLAIVGNFNFIDDCESLGSTDDKSIIGVDDYDPHIMSRLRRDALERRVLVDVTNDTIPDYQKYTKDNVGALSDEDVARDKERIATFIGQ